MNFLKRWAYLPAGLGMIILLFIVTSLLDIVVAVLFARFYNTAAFVVTFGVGGVFAGALSYSKAIELARVKNEFARWSIIILIWITALLFIFPLSALEGGEYKPAFIAYGITTALTTLLFVKGKIDL